MQTQQEKQDLIIGRNAVAEALKSSRTVDTLYILRGEKILQSHALPPFAVSAAVW